MNELIQKVESWAQERDLLKPENIYPQMMKVTEEVGELCRGILKKDQLLIADSYGDVLVTLIIASAQTGHNLIECLEGAFEEIKNRKGKTENGTFIKEP